MNKTKERGSKQIFICTYCGKEIKEDPVITDTRRHSKVYAHYECAFGGRRRK